MRRVGLVLALVFLTTARVEAAEPSTASAPPKSQPPAAPKAAPGAPAPLPAQPAAPAPAPPPASGPTPGDAPPPEFYVEPSTGPTGTPPPPPSTAPEPPGPPPPPPVEGDGRVFEPPAPEFYPEGERVFEPPAPPEPRHVAPRTALWLGVRVGLFLPFGDLWARCPGCTDQYSVAKGVPWRDYASAGPMFELDAGARLARNYTVFALWERAQLGSGKGDPNADPTSALAGKASHGDTDFWGVGVRATSDPDRVGFVTELALGYRRARSVWDDGTELHLTDAPFEARLGIGADIRLNAFVSLSPMFTLGVGSFGKVETVGKGVVSDQMDQASGHAWATLTFGGYFDLFGSRR